MNGEGTERAAVGRRDRKKRQTREAIEAAAWRLFIRKGFDATTVDDIADAADIAPRTFFRYFESKEAVLFGDWRRDLDEFCACLVARPAGEHPLIAIEAAMFWFSDRLESERSLHVQRQQLQRNSVHIRDYERQVMMPAWEEGMRHAIAQRLGVGVDDDLRPRLYAGIAVAVMETVSALSRSSRNLDDVPRLLRSAFAEVRSAAVVPTRVPA